MYFFLRFKEREDCEGLSAQRAELGNSTYEKVNECWEKLHREKNAELRLKSNVIKVVTRRIWRETHVTRISDGFNSRAIQIALNKPKIYIFLTDYVTIFIAA